MNFEYDETSMTDIGICDLDKNDDDISALISNSIQTLSFVENLDKKNIGPNIKIRPIIKRKYVKKIKKCVSFEQNLNTLNSNKKKIDDEISENNKKNKL